MIQRCFNLLSFLLKVNALSMICKEKLHHSEKNIDGLSIPKHAPGVPSRSTATNKLLSATKVMIMFFSEINSTSPEHTYRPSKLKDRYPQALQRCAQDR